MINNIKKYNWLFQPLIQIILFFVLYSLIWSLLNKFELIKRDVSWGILIEYIFISFSILSMLLGVIKYFDLINPWRLSLIFIGIFLIGSGYFLAYSIYRFLLIMIIVMFSVLLAYLITKK